MLYLLFKNGCYYFNRKVPNHLLSHYKSPQIRFSLKTKNKRIAARMAFFQNEKLESYWDTLNRTSNELSKNDYITTLTSANKMGFEYLEPKQISNLPIQQILERLFTLAQPKDEPNKVAAILGGVEEPVLMLDQALFHYWTYSKAKILNKTEDQIRKWKNPKIKAFNNLVECVGNKPLQKFAREDILKLRDWWIYRIEHEDKVPSSANKDLVNIKTVIETLCENLKINLDTQHIFKKLLFENSNKNTRLPFTTDFIKGVILNPQNLIGLDEEAKCVLSAFAETGAGVSELIGLIPEEIKLEDDIPHICIYPHKGHTLKKKYRKRTIPLVGYALEAFKTFPDGFSRYKGMPDSLTNILNKHFRGLGLFPSPNHSIYSLRHSFQDRLLAVNAPDRIQADLMGHKFNRPSYGEGGTLIHKLEFMKKIMLKQSS
ncbi:site-specific integrase [Ferruginibacter albus]|uniref:site-specific integrase n=1 Tax=Ferruginibacter albus TaxID=2875540 RepID=UPI001CC82F37|nr:site-specific integrase [Ferruginibacter albus]UAY53188.1 hypothetical protein K9M53_05830 [Ferruginibacter albus]